MLKQQRILVSIFTACLVLVQFVKAEEVSKTQRQEKIRAVSQAGDLAAGLILGSPTGLSVKYWTGRTNALDAVLGFPFDSDVKLNFHMNYLWQFPISANVPGELPFYIGLGARLRSIDKPNQTQKVDFGVRIPIGLEFSPQNVPLNFFAELAPVIVFTPSGAVNVDAGIGIRYRFGNTIKK